MKFLFILFMGLIAGAAAYLPFLHDGEYSGFRTLGFLILWLQLYLLVKSGALVILKRRGMLLESPELGPKTGKIIYRYDSILPMANKILGLPYHREIPFQTDELWSFVVQAVSSIGMPAATCTAIVVITSGELNLIDEGELACLAMAYFVPLTCFFFAKYYSRNRVPTVSHWQTAGGTHLGGTEIDEGEPRPVQSIAYFVVALVVLFMFMVDVEAAGLASLVVVVLSGLHLTVKYFTGH